MEPLIPDIIPDEKKPSLDYPNEDWEEEDYEDEDD